MRCDPVLFLAAGRLAVVRRTGLHPPALGIFPSVPAALGASRRKTCTVLPRVSAPRSRHRGGGAGKPQVSVLGLRGGGGMWFSATSFGSKSRAV